MAESFRKEYRTKMNDIASLENIISNISYLPGKKIILNLPPSAAPRAFMKEELSKLIKQYPENLIVLALLFIGRRVVKITPETADKFVTLLDNRRHSIYYGIAHGKKVHVAFSWNKLKHFSHQEHEFLKVNLHENSFESGICNHCDASIGNARFLIVKTGGIALENLIYRYTTSK